MIGQRQERHRARGTEYQPKAEPLDDADDDDSGTPV